MSGVDFFRDIDSAKWYFGKYNEITINSGSVTSSSFGEILEMSVRATKISCCRDKILQQGEYSFDVRLPDGVGMDAAISQIFPLQKISYEIGSA